MPSLLVRSLVPVTLVAGIAAQSPCGSPSTITQVFGVLSQSSVHPTFVPDPTVGANLLFDLETTAVTIDRIGIWLQGEGDFSPSLPMLVGRSTQLLVHTTPTTWVGNETNQLLWTQVGSGSLSIEHTSSGFSIATFSPPISISPGTYGVALQILPVTTGSPTGPVMPWLSTAPMPQVHEDQFLRLTGGAFQSTAFSGAATTQNNPTFIGDLHHLVAPGTAHFAEFGSGCAPGVSFHEQFPAGVFDLAQSALGMTFHGGPYTVAATAATIAAPASASLTSSPPAFSLAPGGAAAWDDAETGPLTLPFSFPFPNGSTTEIVVGSNGYVLFGSGNGSAQPNYGSGIPPFGSAGLGLGALWSDLDPSAGGTMHFEVDPGNQFATVTWWNVPQYGAPSTSASFQVALFANGRIELRYGSCTLSTPGAGVGLSAVGFSSVTRDLSASVPFGTGMGGQEPRLTASARPILGTTIDLRTERAEGDAIGGFVFLGVGASWLVPGVNLAPFGLEGCYQHVMPIQMLAFPVSGTTGSLSLNLVGGPEFVGLPVVAQSMLVVPSATPLGLLPSNGLCLKLGNP